MRCESELFNNLKAYCYSLLQSLRSTERLLTLPDDVDLTKPIIASNANRSSSISLVITRVISRSSLAISSLSRQDISAGGWGRGGG
jgi:hypothetical protein